MTAQVWLVPEPIAMAVVIPDTVTGVGPLSVVPSPRCPK